MYIKRLGGVLLAVVLFVASSGCEAFVRKFTRKPKKEDQPREELVLHPEEYPAAVLSPAQRYQESSLYWKAWQDELLQALGWGSNHKKQLSCAEESLKQLVLMRQLMQEPLQKSFDAVIADAQQLLATIESDPYAMQRAQSKLAAERIRRTVLRDFSFAKVKDRLQ